MSKAVRRDFSFGAFGAIVAVPIVCAMRGTKSMNGGVKNW